MVCFLENVHSKCQVPSGKCRCCWSGLSGGRAWEQREAGAGCAARGVLAFGAWVTDNVLRLACWLAFQMHVCLPVWLCVCVSVCASICASVYVPCAWGNSSMHASS